MKPKLTQDQLQQIASAIKIMEDAREYGRELTLAESLTLRDSIALYEEVAQYFFFIYMEPYFAMMLEYVNANSKREIFTLKEITDWIFTGFYDKGKWSRLVSYQGLNGKMLRNWVTMIAAQIVGKVLEAEYGIIISKAKRVSNYNLTLLSMKSAEEVYEVVSLVKVKRMRRLLFHLYVKKMKEDKVAAFLKYTSKELFEKEKNLAHKMLIEALLIKESLYYPRKENGHVKYVDLVPLAISPKIAKGVAIKLEDAPDHSLSTEDDTDWVNVGGEMCNRNDFLEKKGKVIFYEIEKWDAKKSYVFYERFFSKTAPEKLACSLGIRRDNVDNIFSRTRKEFIIYSIKRQKCESMLNNAAKVILKHSNGQDATRTPANENELNEVCCTPVKDDDVTMCIEIAQLFGMNITLHNALNLMEKYGIAHKVKVSELGNRCHSIRGKSVFVPDVAYVEKATRRNTAKEVEGFLDQKILEIPGNLTAAMGLTFLKQMIDATTLSEDEMKLVQELVKIRRTI